jgi:hypothetical protein
MRVFVRSMADYALGGFEQISKQPVFGNRSALPFFGVHRKYFPHFEKQTDIYVR